MQKIVIEKISIEDQIEKGVNDWPLWTKEISRFDWEYSEAEECYILEGEIIVETSAGNYHIVPGDFVTFKKGLQCTWNIKSPVKKHYNFP